MNPPPSPGPSEPPLFDAETLLAAAATPADSHVHRLCLSEDPQALDLRRVLEHCWAHAGDSRDVLRKGLMNERWGQHAGALAHLLALGLFRAEGFDVLCEPALGNQAPDLLVERQGFRALVEVRSITGCGETPWDHTDDVPDLPALPPPAPLHGTRSREAVRRITRARARKLAALRAEARRAQALTGDEDLREVVVRVLEQKAAAYRELCAAEDIAYLICLYQDTDDQLTAIVCDWAFGQAEREQDPDGGTFFGERGQLGHVSGVVVIGRREDAAERVTLRGDLIVNPHADRPLPASPLLPHLRTYRLDDAVSPPRMRWSPSVASAFEIAPRP